MGFTKALLLLVVVGTAFAAVAKETEVKLPEENELSGEVEVGDSVEATFIEACLVPPSGKRGYGRHPSDCRKFIQDAPYGAQVMQCAPGTVWDQDQRKCEHADAIRCRVGIYRFSSGERCPGDCQFECPRAYGFFPHPRDCQRFFKCQNGEARYRTCGRGKLFDTVTSTCIEEALVTCNTSYDADC